MATVTYKGRTFDVDDGDRQLLDYYRAEDAAVSNVHEAGTDVFPKVFTDGRYVSQDAAGPAVGDAQPADAGTGNVFRDDTVGDDQQGIGFAHPQPGPSPDPSA